MSGARVPAIGERVVFDGHRGTVPCVIVGWDRWGMHLRATATVGAYTRGTVFSAGPAWVIPADAIRRTKYGSSVRPHAGWSIPATAAP